MPFALVLKPRAAWGAREAKESRKARHIARPRCIAQLMRTHANMSLVSRIPTLSNSRARIMNGRNAYHLASFRTSGLALTEFPQQSRNRGAEVFPKDSWVRPPASISHRLRLWRRLDPDSNVDAWGDRTRRQRSSPMKYSSHSGVSNETRHALYPDDGTPVNLRALANAGSRPHRQGRRPCARFGRH